MLVGALVLVVLVAEPGMVATSTASIDGFQKLRFGMTSSELAARYPE